MTGLISFLSKGLSRVFSSTRFEGINSLVLSLLCDPTLKSIYDYWKNHSFDYMDLCEVMPLLFNMLSRFIMAFLPGSKCLLISWLQSSSAVILESRKIKSSTVSRVSLSICHEVMAPKQIDYILCSQRWRSSIQSGKTRPGADYGSDHELLITKFRLRLKKVWETTRPFRYDLNQIPYDYTVEVRNRFKGLDLIDRVPDEL